MFEALMEKIFNHITNWGKFWFGLIFLGSIFNAIIEKSNFFDNSPNISIWAFGLGALIGLIAKIRGAWL